MTQLTMVFLVRVPSSVCVFVVDGCSARPTQEQKVAQDQRGSKKKLATKEQKEACVYCHAAGSASHCRHGVSYLLWVSNPTRPTLALPVGGQTSEVEKKDRRKPTISLNHDRTRTDNLLIRSQTPCPLGHAVKTSHCGTAGPWRICCGPTYPV